MQPGDNVLFYTDGVIEARSQSGEFFGLPRLAEFLTRALATHLPQPETMREHGHTPRLRRAYRQSPIGYRVGAGAVSLNW